MGKRVQAGVWYLAAIAVLGWSTAFADKGRNAAATISPAIKENPARALWRGDTDRGSENVFYGPGGQAHRPHGVFTFVKEDLDGTNPKFVVRDDQGVKWKVKLGAEARPETAASRLVWAAGYYANEDYFLPVIRVENLPRLHRGQGFVQQDGSIRAVRLKRYLDGETKIGNWQWRDNPFSGTRELNGLRVMMALINNWDLTDENNSTYGEQEDRRALPPRVYMVSDLGSSFGTPGLTWPVRNARGNLSSYRQSVFVRRTTSTFVDFGAPRRDSLFFLFTPREYLQKIHLGWIGRHIPREDARWIGRELAELAPGQIRDAFRAAGYDASQAQGFTEVVLARIAELKSL